MNKKYHNLDYSQFLTLKLDFLKNKQNEIEISIFLQITDLNIFIDQLTIKFLFNFFKFGFNKNSSSSQLQEKSTNLENKQETIKETASFFNNSVSLINPNPDLSNIKEELEQNLSTHTNLTKNIEKLYTRRFIIQEFFINFSYNSQKLKFDKVAEKEIMDKLKIPSMSELKIVFGPIDIRNKNTLTEAIKFTFNFWTEDIFKRQFINAYLGSIPYIRPFRNVIKGFFELFSIPYNYYLEDKPIRDGFVKGMKNFILKLSTESLLFGDNVCYFYF